MILHACIFATYDVLKTLTELWAEKCTSLLVAEHPADGKTKRIHCHFMIEHDLADDNPFRESGKKILKEFFKRGNYWIASRVQKGEHQGETLDKFKTMVYILKGKYTPSFTKNISHNEVEQARLAWVPTDQIDPSEDSPRYSEVCTAAVQKIVEQKLNAKRYVDDEDGIELYRRDTVLDLCRTEAYKMLYFKRRMAPHPSLYKTVAASAFTRIMESQNKLDEAVIELKNLWY